MPLFVSDSPKATLTSIKLQLETLSVRVAIMETKQIAHDLAFKEYTERKDRDEMHAREEWAKFARESAEDRKQLHEDNQTIRNEMWDSNTALLWRIIGAMFALFTTIAGILAAFFHAGVIH